MQNCSAKIVRKKLDSGFIPSPSSTSPWGTCLEPFQQMVYYFPLASRSRLPCLGFAIPPLSQVWELTFIQILFPWTVPFFSTHESYNMILDGYIFTAFIITVHYHMQRLATDNVALSHTITYFLLAKPFPPQSQPIKRTGQKFQLFSLN